MIKAGVINKYSQVCKKKEKKKKKRFCCYFHLRRVSLNYKQLIPVLYKREDGGKQERWNKTTFMDLIRSNKKSLRHGRFCSFQCYKIWLDCLNFKHWPILSSASGALLIFTVKSTLNYTRVLRQPTKKTKINYTQIRRRCMRHLFRTYAVWELIYQIWDRQTVLIKTKKKRKKTGAFKRCILLSLSVKRPLISWTCRLHLDVLQSQCIHTCHKNGLIIRLPLLMIRVNRLFTAQRSVKCWFFDNVWIMT